MVIPGLYLKSLAYLKVKYNIFGIVLVKCNRYNYKKLNIFKGIKHSIFILVLVNYNMRLGYPVYTKKKNIFKGVQHEAII